VLDPGVVAQPREIFDPGDALLGDDQRSDHGRQGIAAVELQDDQDAAVFLGSGGARQEARQGRRQPDQRRIAQAAGE
jgi:hypothetical protein